MVGQALALPWHPNLGSKCVVGREAMLDSKDPMTLVTRTLLLTSATLVVTSALLVVTRSYY